VISFVLVRAQAKLEAPLRALRNNGGAIVISTVPRSPSTGRPERQHGVGRRHDLGEFRGLGDPSSSGR